jgi:hypothetical protein
MTFITTTMTNSESSPSAVELMSVSTPLENTPVWPWNPDAPIAAPLCLHSPHVSTEWVDYNGVMSESSIKRLGLSATDLVAQWQ